MKPDRATSLTLLDRVRASDQDAWGRLVGLYGPLVRYWCRRRGVPEGDVDDLAQEVFQAVASGIDQFRRDRPGDTFRGWLRGVVHHKSLDWLRRRGRQPDAAGGTEACRLLLAVPDPDATPDDNDPGERSQLADLYHRALELVRGEFEPRTWQAFWRAAIDGHAVADIARDLGVTPSAVLLSKSRVLRRLKEEVGDLIA